MGTWGKRGLLGAAVAALLALPAGATAQPIVTEYDAGLTSASSPMGVALGPEGAVWFTENARNVVGHIHPDGDISEYGGMTGSAPRGITQGPDGNMWFTETAGGNGAIGRVTPDGAIADFDLGLLSGSPAYITNGADGNLWFTETGLTGAIGRITPTGSITEYSLGLTINSAPWGITAGPDGNVWFTEKFNPGRIGRIAPDGTITEFGGLPAGLPQEIAPGPDGNLWFTAGSNPGYIGRITPQGVVTTFSTGLTPNSYPQGIAAGPDGAMWFTEKTASAIGRITMSGEITEYRDLLSASSAPFGIVAGSDGAMWFAESGLTGHLGRIGTTPPEPRATGSEPQPAATTPSAPVHGDTAADAAEPPAPALGATVAVTASKGTILVRRPGQRGFTPLDGAGLQPVGTEIDARRGTVVLTSALAGGRTQHASFRGARFKVRQSAAGAGMTDIVLTEPVVAGARSGASAASTTRRKPPSLWAHDSHGRYRTFGHNSVATVRGTTWRTTELAAGTLTQVSSGAVSVRDLRRHRSVLVRAGHRYLARGKLRG